MFARIMCAIHLRTNCLGGWSFIILAMGAMIFLPATLFTGLYIKYTIYTKEEEFKVNAPKYKVVGLAFFGTSVGFTSIGIGVCILWMIRASAKNEIERKRKEESEMTKQRYLDNGEFIIPDETAFGIPPKESSVIPTLMPLLTQPSTPTMCSNSSPEVCTVQMS